MLQLCFFFTFIYLLSTDPCAELLPSLRQGVANEIQETLHSREYYQEDETKPKK
jgi:hypothetical protein